MTRSAALMSDRQRIVPSYITSVCTPWSLNSSVPALVPVIGRIEAHTSAYCSHSLPGPQRASSVGTNVINVTKSRICAALAMQHLPSRADADGLPLAADAGLPAVVVDDE